jgi:hypothetical protein
MQILITPAEFADWEPRQPVRFALLNGQPVRLPVGEQAAPRLSCIRTIAARVLASGASVETWLTTPSPALGGLAPADLAAEDEQGCQMVLRLLIDLGREGAANHG